MKDVTIIGAGLAGLMAGWQIAKAGRRVNVVAKGWGATHWLSGCIDVLGYYPVDEAESVSSPEQSVAALIDERPQHPYALVGVERLAEALAELQDLCSEAGYPLQGSLERNWLLPSAVGTFRPTCLAPRTMTAGDLQDNASMLIVGFQQLLDFFPNIVADNLTQQGVEATHVTLNLPTLAARNFTTPTILAQLLEEKESFRAEVAAQLKPHIGSAGRIGFPSVLGMEQAMGVKADLEKRLKRPIFEIPSLTPSVPGMRLHRILSAAILRHGGRVEAGQEAIGAKAEGGRVTAVYTETAARPRPHRAHSFVLATGGILGGGITTDYAGNVQEVVFDLPVTAPDSRVDWFHQDFLDKRGHPIYQSGLTVNEQFQPLNGRGPVYENLYAAGTTLAHCEVVRERSFEGVALATGYAVAQMV